MEGLDGDCGRGDTEGVYDGDVGEYVGELGKYRGCSSASSNRTRLGARRRLFRVSASATCDTCVIDSQRLSQS